MSVAAVACLCGSSDSLIRNFLKKAGYPDWLTMPVVKGKDKSLKHLNTIPQFSEIQMLTSYIKDSSKWAVIIGYDSTSCRWADIAHNAVKSKIDAEYIVKRFA